MENKALLILLESVLGKGQKTSGGNYIFVCPFHVSSPPGKKKLEVDLETNHKKENPYHCWACNQRGKTIKALLKNMKAPQNKINELNLIIKPGHKEEYKEIGVADLPKEFIPLDDITNLSKTVNISARHALKYLHKRRIKSNDIIKYNIGFCNEGKYSGRVIIPSYDGKGRLNYFIARDYSENPLSKYKNPPFRVRDTIGWELYINFDLPIILVEGIFDALTIKRNVIPLFGKVIHPILMQKLVKSSVNRIYIALDKDARKEALKYCEELMNYGKEVYLVEINNKDFSEIGFEKSLELLENTYPLTFSKMIELKMEQ